MNLRFCFNALNKGMDKVYLRSLFLREKGFLKKLYLGEEGTSVLILANDKSLDVLIRVLHLLASGEIPMRKQDEIVLRNAKKFNVLRKFMLKSFFLELLNKATRETKIKELKLLIKVYPVLLYSFFNEI